MNNKLTYKFLVACLALIFSCEQEKEDWKPVEGDLFTNWTLDVTPETVWQQYPRPQLERQEWKNLNGLWQYTIIPQNDEKPKKFQGRILVPFPVESALSGVKKKVGSDKKLWYKRTFTIPEKWNERDIALHFEAVDWETEVWLNGESIGTHKGGYDHFKFIIKPKQLKTVNELVVGVSDPTDTGWQAVGKQVEKPGGIFYTSVTGIWQTVWLEPLNEVYLESYKINTDITQSKVIISPKITRVLNEHKLKASVYFKEKLIVEVVSDANQDVQLIIPEAQLWSPNIPNLYNLKLEIIKDNEILDEVKGYFGMRSIALAKTEDGFNKLFLNGNPVFHNGPLDQGFWPDGIYTPPTEEAMLYDLEVIKKLGFNMLRKHVKIEPRRFYYLCDKIGLMVWQDMPNGDKKIGPHESDIIRTEESAEQFEFELTKLINGHYNHPSIVMWVPFNEGWGQYDTERIANYTKLIDSTRFVNSVSGWADRGVGDVHDIHNYPHPISPEPEAERAVVLGEFGGLGLPIKQHTWEEENWGYTNLTSKEALINTYEDYYSDVWELKKTKGLAAAVYTQITDVETETNGLMTYDRKVLKVDIETIKMINTNNYLPIPKIIPFGGLIHQNDKVLIESTKKTTLRYTLDGTEPSAASEEYKNGINLKQNRTLKVKAFLDNMESRTVTVKFEITDLLKPQYKFKYSKKYAAGGNYALIDGVEGGDEFSKNWQGFEGEDLDVIIDLGKEKDIKSVNTSTIQHQGHWIFHPKNITIFTSKDGKKFKEIKQFNNEVKQSDINNQIKNYTVKVSDTIRYIRVLAKNVGKCPEWHLGKGGKAWVFVDEINIE